MQIILKTLWALSLVVFSATYVFGQDYTVRQDIGGSTDQAERRISVQLVDATDGYTPETGLSPTCTIQAPGATSFSSCNGSVSETGNGWYRVPLGATEWETLGNGLVHMTGTGARPRSVTYKVIESGSVYKDGASLNKSPNNYSSGWTLGGVTNTQNTTATYDGYTIADTLTGDGATSEHKATVAITKPDGGGLFFVTAEVKSGTLNNAWIGDDNYGTGVDINTSTGVATPTTAGYLRGWKVSKLASSWWRVDVLLSTGQTDATGNTLTIALGNGTAGTSAPSFSTSGTMIFARAFAYRADDISPEYLAGVLPNIASASSGSSITLDANASSSSIAYIGREVCFPVGYTATIAWKEIVLCSCVSNYDGTTKVLSLTDSLSTTLNNTYKYRFGGTCLKNVNASSISTGAITATAIASDAITASAIANDAIGSSEIAADAIGSSEIAADAIGSSEIAADAIGSSEIASSAIGASELATDAITDVKMSTAARNAIADTTWRRSSTNIEGSSYGDTLGYKSGYGVIAQQTHKSNTALGVRNTYKADGTTVLNSRSYTSDPLAKPITGLD